VSLARVYIVDEHHSVRLALADRLSRSVNLQVIGHTGSADEALREVRLECPDIVLMEIKRSDGMGLEILRQLSTLSKAPRVIILTSYSSFWERQAASRAGACSYILKDIETEELIHHLTDLI
jgi:DNA-binding NarL/FixJ family response regulator